MQRVVDTKLYSDAPVLSGDFINTSDVKIYFSASHIQSSVKLCYPYNYNTVYKSGLLLTPFKALQTVREKHMAHMDCSAAVPKIATSPQGKHSLTNRTIYVREVGTTRSFRLSSGG